jgi:outer membrane protein TolC
MTNKSLTNERHLWSMKASTTAKNSGTVTEEEKFKVMQQKFESKYPPHSAFQRALGGLFVLIILFLHINISKAQSLDDYLIQAAENNPGLKAAYARYEAAAERTNQPGLPDPELQVGFFYKPMERYMGNQTADLKLMQMFPWFGMIGTQKEEANQMALAQYQLFLEEKNQLFFQVKSAWYELMRLKEEVKITAENLEYLRKYEELALVRFRVGSSNSSGSKAPSPSSSQTANSSTSTVSAGSMNTMNGMGGNSASNMSASSSMSSGMGSSSMNTASSGMNAILQIRLQIREMENTLQQLQANLEPLQIKFNQLLNREIRAEISQPDQLARPEISLQKQEILDSIRQNNPMLAMYQAELGAYEQQAKMARLEGKPMLGAGVNYMTFTPRPDHGVPMGGENMVMPMVSVTFPIYRRKINSRVKEAEHLKEATLLERQKTENLLTMEWANAFRDLEESERNLRLYEDQVAIVQQQIQLLETSFSSGGANFEDVLQANQLLLDYRLKRLNALNQQHQSLSFLEALVSSSLNF